LSDYIEGPEGGVSIPFPSPKFGEIPVPVMIFFRNPSPSFKNLSVQKKLSKEPLIGSIMFSNPFIFEGIDYIDHVQGSRD
jgi:hypothetical protein